MKKKKKINYKYVFAYILLVGGLFLFISPYLSSFLYNYRIEKEYREFKDENEKKPSEKNDFDKKVEAYNKHLIKQDGFLEAEDPFSKKNIENTSKYAEIADENNRLGFLEIPSLNQVLPIYPGTSQGTLAQGVGHLMGTSFPIGGRGSHCALTGHSGLPNARLFTDLEKLDIGDGFYIRNQSELLIYRVDEINVVEPKDFSQLKIDEDEDYVTLITCTPYGINSHRLLVRGSRVNKLEDLKEKEDNKKNLIPAKWGLLIVLVLVFLLYKKRKK